MTTRSRTAELAKTKLSRDIIKAAATQLRDELELSVNDQMAAIDDIEETLELLSLKEIELYEVDRKYEDLIDDLEELETELKVAYLFRDNITLWKHKASRRIRKETTNNARSDSVSDSVSVVSAARSRPVPNLPLLEIPKFDGDIMQWKGFWSRFQSSIGQTELTKVEKYNYLASYLIGDAKDALANLTASDEAYDELVSVLEREYGRNDLIIHKHQSQLLHLEPVPKSNDTKALRKFYNTCLTNIKCLQGLGVDTNSPGNSLCTKILECLPSDIRLSYSLTRHSDADWNVDEVLAFLRKNLEARERSELLNTHYAKRNDSSGNFHDRQDSRDRYRYSRSENRQPYKLASANALATQVSNHQVDKTFCIFCKNTAHNSTNCDAMSLEDKKTKIREESRCFICLRRNHTMNRCRSKFRSCRLCKRTHNVAICENNQANLNQDKKNETSIKKAVELQEVSVKPIVTTVCTRSSQKTVLLQTANAIARNPTDERHSQFQIRCLFDGGSEATFIKEDISRALNLPVIEELNISISNFGNQHPVEQKRRKVKLCLQNSRDPQVMIYIEAIEVPFLCKAVTLLDCEEVTDIMEQRGLELVDVMNVNKSCASIGLLIGSDYYWEIVSGNVQRLGSSVVAIETRLGWTIQGPVDSRNVGVNAINCSITSLRVGVEENKVSKILESFWELEAIGIVSRPELPLEGNKVLEQFKRNVSFQNGRYEVRLPWITEKENLPNNMTVAIQRMKGLVRRFKFNPSLYNDYKKIIEEQLELGISEEVQTTPGPGSYYVPHQPVIRNSSSTTKLRIVFDASAHIKGSPSLNNLVSSGPNLNPDMLKLILRFRIHKIAITADIAKAFLQVSLAAEDRDSVRYFWVYEEDGRIVEDKYRTLRMARVPFGIAASPFLLAATVKTHLRQFDSNSPEIVALENDLYVDDLLTGAEDSEKAYTLSTKIISIVEEAGMQLRKWNSNSSELKQMWGNSAVKSEGVPLFESEPDNDDRKILGLIWNPKKDNLSFNLANLIDVLQNLKKTKRFVLSAVAQVFDPLGVLAPFMIRAKFLFQGLWKIKELKWDENLPKDHGDKFEAWSRELPLLRKFGIPRYYFYEADGDIKQLQIHCFCDSSTKAYAAVTYVKFTTSSGKMGVSLIAAKARVAPLTELTLPRLELMGCLLGARLVNYVKDTFQRYDVKIYYWTDSTIALHWVKNSTDAWKPFVSNRVNEVQKLTNKEDWYHVPGTQNPADLPTRGLTAQNLIDSDLWWQGPSWLKENEEFWPKIPNNFPSQPQGVEDEKRKLVLNVHCEETIGLHNLINLKNNSSLSKVLRITAWVFRCVDKFRKRKINEGPVNAKELKRAETAWVRSIQRQDFSQEIIALNENKPIKSSKITTLRPVYNENKVLCVGGRLGKSNMEYHEKHPIIILKTQRLAELLIWRSHLQTLHGGVQETLTQLRETYWITTARQLTQNVLRKCTICKRLNAKPCVVETAPLPKERIEQSPPFSILGIDFAGPIFVKNDKKLEKSYICLFTCAVSRALHLELVPSLNTSDFLLAFRRMISRRGIPAVVYSDNAKTFKKAQQELNAIWKSIDKPEVKAFFGEKGIEWRYIVERAAWWGGYWERLVRSTKTTLKKILGRATLTYTEMETVLIEAEASINSRPISFVYNQANEPSPLCPSHLLLGKRVTSLPPINGNLEPRNETRQTLDRRARYQELLKQRFWNRWKREYLLELRSAHHVAIAKRETIVKVGHVMLLHTDKIPKHMWKLCVVTETMNGRDGKIRSCVVRTSNGSVIRRPIQLLYPLEIRNDE